MHITFLIKGKKREESIEESVPMAVSFETGLVWA